MRPNAATRVVIVDDDGNQAAALASLLRMEGLDALSEVIPRVALEHALADPPDAMILNVKMPGLSGPELLAALRQSHPDMPAVLVTGFEPNHDELATVLHWERVAYVAKPVRVDTMLDELARVMERR